jgi:hypothetical protein
MGMVDAIRSVMPQVGGMDAYQMSEVARGYGLTGGRRRKSSSRKVSRKSAVRF